MTAAAVFFILAAASISLNLTAAAQNWLSGAGLSY